MSTRNNKRPTDRQLQLHRDIETFPSKTFTELALLRYPQFGDNRKRSNEEAKQLFKSLENRFHYLKTLKTSKTQHYWALYSESTIAEGDNEASSLDKDTSHNAEDQNSDDEDQEDDSDSSVEKVKHKNSKRRE